NTRAKRTVGAGFKPAPFRFALSVLLHPVERVGVGAEIAMALARAGFDPALAAPAFAAEEAPTARAHQRNEAGPRRGRPRADAPRHEGVAPDRARIALEQARDRGAREPEIGQHAIEFARLVEAAELVAQFGAEARIGARPGEA